MPEKAVAMVSALCCGRPKNDVDNRLQFFQLVRAVKSFKTTEIDCHRTVTRRIPSNSPCDQHSSFIKVFRTQVEQLRDFEIGEKHVVILVFDFSGIVNR